MQTRLSFEKYKTLQSVENIWAHIFRTIHVPNANPDLTRENIILMGAMEPGPMALMEESQITKTIQGQVLWLGGVAGASPEYFRPQKPERYGFYEKEPMEAWLDASQTWLKSIFNSRLRLMVLHLDEASPHLHFMILPLNNQGQLNFTNFLGNSHLYRDLPKLYSQALTPLGFALHRGGYLIDRNHLDNYYRAVLQKEEEEMPGAPLCTPPLPPSRILRALNPVVLSYGRKTAEKAYQEYHNHLAIRVQVLSEFIREEKKSLDRIQEEAMELYQELAVQKQLAAKIRDFSLPRLLTLVFGAKAQPSTRRFLKDFVLPNGKIIRISKSHWFNGQMRGKGALNLALTLCPSLIQSLKMISPHFSELSLKTALASYLSQAPKMPTETIYQKPKADPEAWKVVYLRLKESGVATGVLNNLYQTGTLYCTRGGILIHSCLEDTGHFATFLGTDQTTAHGPDHGPALITGTAPKIFVVSSPLEALAFKTRHKKAWIMTVDPEINIKHILPYIKDKEVYLKQKPLEKFTRQNEMIMERVPLTSILEERKKKKKEEVKRLEARMD